MKNPPKPKPVHMPSVSERMVAIMDDEPNTVDYSAAQWAGRLGVNMSSVKRSAAWLDITRRRRANQLTEIEMSILAALVKLKAASAETIVEATGVHKNTVRAKLTYFISKGYASSQIGGSMAGYYYITDTGVKHYESISGKKKK